MTEINIIKMKITKLLSKRYFNHNSSLTAI